jgi:hypothetical protein
VLPVTSHENRLTVNLRHRDPERARIVERVIRSEQRDRTIQVDSQDALQISLDLRDANVDRREISGVLPIADQRPGYQEQHLTLERDRVGLDVAAPMHRARQHVAACGKCAGDHPAWDLRERRASADEPDTDGQAQQGEEHAQ